MGDGSEATARLDGWSKSEQSETSRTNQFVHVSSIKKQNLLLAANQLRHRKAFEDISNPTVASR